MEITLGKVYKDKITGFTGVAVSRTVFLYSCARVGLQPQEMFEGKTVQAEYFDEHQIEEVPKKKGIVVPEKVKNDPGGPGDAAPRQRVASMSRAVARR